MKISKSDARSSARSLPQIRFEDQDLSSFSGLVLFQALFNKMQLKARLKKCFAHLSSGAPYQPHNIVFLLVVHLILGWRRLRDLDYYRDDPLVLRTLGLKCLPSVSTVSRSLRDMDEEAVHRSRKLSRGIVLERVEKERLPRLTIDFDGSVQSTKSRNTEGTAVGFNRKAKGQRSYYPLFATLAQTGQVLDFLHRPGNVHDSNGAREFIEESIENVRNSGFQGILEARMDSAHFNEAICFFLDEQNIEFSVTVPFERFPELKTVIEARQRWRKIDDEWAFFEDSWKPKKWPRGLRCICYRHQVKKARKGPIQLDFFEPVSMHYEYKVVATNKIRNSGTVLNFHNGRGSQESIFGELKSQLNMDYLPTRRLIGNQIYLQSGILAHNLNRELQMESSPRVYEKNTLKRACLWIFEKMDTLRKRIIQRAGRLTRPQGTLTLTMSANKATASEFDGILSSLNA
jgi:hypothetical protein